MNASRLLLAALLGLSLLAPLPAASAGPPKIAFVGDSMADGIWGAFFRLAGRMKCGADQVVLLRNARNGTGLARPDHFDWDRELADLIAREQPNLIFASVGLNDRQDYIGRDKSRFHLGTDEWLAAYRAGVASFFVNAGAGGIPVLIVGIPNLKDGRADAHASLLNSIYSEAAGAQDGVDVTYLEPWRLTNGDGTFTSYGPNLKGQTVQLRAPDGVHFTPAGYDVLADYLGPPVRQALAEQHLLPGNCLGE